MSCDLALQYPNDEEKKRKGKKETKEKAGVHSQCYFYIIDI